MSFKSDKTGKVDQINPNEIESVNFQKFVGHYGIRLFMKNGSLHRYSGFSGEEKKIAEYFKKNYKLEMLEKELSMRGWNWGTVQFNGAVLSFDVENKTSFEIPLSHVSQCTTGKNEVTMEFHQNDDAPVSLMEMRYHIPTTESSDTDPVDAFYQNVMTKASVISVSGDAIAIFREIPCLTPRYVSIYKEAIIFNLLILNYLFFLVVATTSKYSNPSFNCMVKHLITKFHFQLCYVCSYCHIKTIVKCSLLYHWIHQLNKVKHVIIFWYYFLEWRKKQALNCHLLMKN